MDLLQQGLESLTLIKNKTNIILGDISFFYDSNSLLIAKQQNININIFIMNNSGGQILINFLMHKKMIKTLKNFG